MLSVGRAKKRSACRTCGVHKSFEFERRDDVFRLRISELVELFHRDRVEARRNNYRAVFFFDYLILRFVIYRACGADLRANAAFSRFQHRAVIRVDRGDLRNRLRERDIYRSSVVHTEVELVRHFFLRTFLGAESASCANILFDISRLLPDLDVEIADETADFGHLGIGKDPDILILSDVYHLRRQNASGAVQSRECLVELSHFSADRRFFLNYIDGKTRICDVESGLNSRNASADNERAFRNGALSGGERRVEIDFCDSGFREDYRFFRTYRHLFMYPRALLADICDLDHIRVQPCGGCRFSESRFVHTRRTGADNNTRQFVFGNGGFDHILSRLGTHILIVGGENDARFVLQRRRNGFYINRSGYIRAAMANENSDPLHGSFLLSYLEYLRSALMIAC